MPTLDALFAITDAVAGRRRLHAAAATVAFAVTATDYMEADDLSGSISTLGTAFMSALNTNLASAGVSGVTVSSVTMTATPTITTTIAAGSTAVSAAPREGVLCFLTTAVVAVTAFAILL